MDIKWTKVPHKLIIFFFRKEDDAFDSHVIVIFTCFLPMRGIPSLDGNRLFAVSVENLFRARWLFWRIPFLHLCYGLEGDKSRDVSIFKRILKKKKNVQWGPVTRILTRKNGAHPLPPASFKEDFILSSFVADFNWQAVAARDFFLPAISRR